MHIEGQSHNARMFRRWLIRSLALTLLTFCVAAWVVSYSGEYGVRPHLQAEIVCGFNDGFVYLVVWMNPDYDIIFPFWDYRPGDSQAYGAYKRAKHHLLGFAYRSSSSRSWYLLVHMWFPTLLSALLLCFVWRKTRAKPIGGAFPVEVAARE